MAHYHFSVGIDPRAASYGSVFYQRCSLTPYAKTGARTLASFQLPRYSVVGSVPRRRLYRKRLGAVLTDRLVDFAVCWSIRCRLSYNSLDREGIIDANLRIRLRRLRRSLRTHRHEPEAIHYMSEV